MAYKKLKLWFDRQLAVELADSIHAVDENFSKEAFKSYITSRIETLELKDRIEVFSDALHIQFEDEYLTGIQTLLTILGPENNKETGMFTNYYWILPIAKYVEKYGLEYFDQSLNAIKEITKRSTGEYAIRPYIEAFPKKTMSQMELWSNHPNAHVRRLSCEGARPRLPWAKKLDIFIQNPSPILAIIENLKDDSSKYVQKSVANMVNDILKDNPNKIKPIIERWTNENPGKERKWIIKHALRNLLKSQDPWAIAMIS